MLLEIRFKNYKNMVSETKFSMLSEALAEHKYCLLTSSAKPSLRALPIKLIYGPAAVEKQNIFVGLKIIQMILNDQIRISSNLMQKLAHVPTSPVHLGLTVAAEQWIYDYDFSFLGNTFVQEIFKVNSSTLFERHGSDLRITKTPKTLSYYDNLLRKHLDLTEKLFKAKGDHMNDRLFLTSLFSCFIIPEIITPFLNQLSNKLIFLDDSKFELIRRKRILAQYAGTDLRISAPTQDPTHIAQLMLKYCIDNGICLVMGEHITSFDPLELIPYLKALHNINLNKGSQLLLFTNQPLYMHKYLIRRDEVCYLHQEKDGLHISNLSQCAVREENYIRKYLLGEYMESWNYRAALKQSDPV